MFQNPIRVLNPNWLKRNYPLTILLLALFAVFITNFSPNTYLLGWDNRAQELSPLLNLKRYIFSVWQEYQGLGLLAGHAHASEIIHSVFITLLSIVFPLNWIRQIFIFITLLLGPLGVYFLVKKLVKYQNQFLNKIIPLLGGLFYLLNFSTVQTFYAPLEPFIISYAALPWLFISGLYFIAYRTKKALIFFLVVNLLAVPQAQIPTVFFVYIFALCFFLFVLILDTRSIEILKRSAKLLLITLIINSFWLLPFIYFYLTNGSVALEAKINQMSTETIFQQNKEFGTVFDVMLLKGFWFNNVDPNLKGNFIYMLAPWKDHLTPLVSAIGYLLFATILTGFVYVKRKAPFVLPFSALFLLAFTMLATNTPPFSWVDFLLRQIPILNEIFRFPFTKFSTLALLTYSFFFAIGIGKFYLFLEKSYKPKVSILYSLIGVFILLMVLLVLPIFKGNLFYGKEKIKIPYEYSQVFNFFKSQDPNTRIANFPQHTFWGWNFYSWGYGGSGFLWYGIKQPILDRAFDVWSKFDENYYWEISYALYSKNPKLFEDVLNKYQINFLLIDKNVINPSSPKALFTPETDELISSLPSIRKKASFGKIDIYQIALRKRVDSFVFVADKNSSVNKYNWSNFDPAYATLPNYLLGSTNSEVFYPFRTLFSGKSEKDREFTLTKDKDYVIFSQKLPELRNSKLNISPLFGENNVAVIFRSEKNPDGSFLINAILETPQIYIDKQKVWGGQLSRSLFLIPKDGPKQFNLAFKGDNIFVDLDKNRRNLGSTYASSEVSIVSLTSNGSFLADLSNEVNSLLAQPTSINLPTGRSQFEVKIPEIDDESLSFSNILSEKIQKKVKNCENFRRGEITSSLEDNLLSLDSKNSTACISFFAPLLPHNQGYAVFVEDQNMAGRPMHFWVLNEDQKTTVLDTYLPQNKEVSITNFVIPAYEKFGQGYSFNFESISISDETKNKLGKVFIYPIPYRFLTSLSFGAPNSGSSAVRTLKVAHPNESLYMVQNVNIQPNGMLVLSQAYDSGWKAYAVQNKSILSPILPFIFSDELKNHVLVNNWENGWDLDSNASNSTIYIVYLPQYLEYLGFVIFLLTLIYLLRLKN